MSKSTRTHAFLYLNLVRSSCRKLTWNYNHRYYTNNTGLEAPFRAMALLVVPEVIDFVVATLVAILFLEDGKFTHIPRTVGKAS